MKCPIDNATLLIAERDGVEIDYCPECRGVWLDRGELDKILARSAGPRPVAADFSRGEDRERDSRRADDRHQDDHRYQDRDTDQKRKKENFLGDLFDF